MGERTQLLIEVKDKNNEEVMATAFHYQWGYGRVMAMEALHVATNLPQGTSIMNPNGNVFDDTIRKNPFFHLPFGSENLIPLLKREGLKDPATAYNFYKYFGKLQSKSASHVDDVDDLLENYYTGSNTDVIFHNILDALYEDPDVWYTWQDNNCGFMRMTVKYEGEKRRLGFPKSTTFHFYDSEYREISFHDYCNMDFNKEYCTPDFEKGFEMLCKNYGIALAEPEPEK